MQYVLLFAVAVIAAFWYWQNDVLKAEYLAIPVDKLPKAFDGARIVLLSDLHGKMFGLNNIRLAEKVLSLKPDAIFFPGDLVDERKGSAQAAVSVLIRMAKRCEVFFAMGNHDRHYANWPWVEDELGRSGVHVLCDSMALWRRGKDAVAVVGLEDSAEGADMSFLERIDLPPCVFALCHRPYHFAAGGAASPEVLGAQAVFSGHNHGGQWRVPKIGGIFAPDQGLFPRYDSGLYEESGGKLIIGRGLGNSGFPLRLNNRPQILLVELKREDKIHA